MDDLVKRLRGRARFCYDRGEIISPGDMMEAADAIEALQARVAGLEGALQWCSGSADFNEGGVAREGWLKICAPIIRALAEKETRS